ncbi:MAG: hypothetical protein J1G07_00270 [Clostridiales bacterium]|nr:hypothetical protein [Clostridiales bacterium]
MEDIIKSVNEAEGQAEEIKSSAEQKAAQILADAEKQAAEILKRSEEKLKIYREEQLKSAQAVAEEEYKNTLQSSAKTAEEYASSLIKRTDIQVNEVVGRVSRGNC